jgi:hypothetical protein
LTFEFEELVFCTFHLSHQEIKNVQPTLAALVRARAHREEAVSGLFSLKKDIELCFREAKSKAFHLD